MWVPKFNMLVRRKYPASCRGSKKSVDRRTPFFRTGDLVDGFPEKRLCHIFSSKNVLKHPHPGVDSHDKNVAQAINYQPSLLENPAPRQLQRGRVPANQHIKFGNPERRMGADVHVETRAGSIGGIIVQFWTHVMLHVKTRADWARNQCSAFAVWELLEESMFRFPLPGSLCEQDMVFANRGRARYWVVNEE